MQGAGSIRQRKNGNWEARYTVGRDPGTGKQIQKSIYGKTQKEVRQKLTQIIASIDDGTFISPSKLTIGAWINMWIKDYIVSVKPATARIYENNCRNHIIPVLGAVRLALLTPGMIQQFYNNLREKGLSDRSVKLVHSVLGKSLGQAVNIGYIRTNPTDACVLPKNTKKEMQFLDDTQIFTFLNEIEGHQLETLFVVTLFTGMRLGEVLGLTWNCINFSDGRINISKQLQKPIEKGANYKLILPKSGKSRWVTMAPYVIKKLSVLGIRQEGFVFTDKNGKHFTPVTVQRNFKKIVEKIGYSSMRFHDLRHSYAVSAIQAGVDIKTIAESLGHHSVAFTLDTYGHVTERMQKESGIKMEKFIQRVVNF